MTLKTRKTKKKPKTAAQEAETDLEEVEEEKALVEMTKLIMKKMDIVQYSSLRLIESVANLLGGLVR